LIHCGRKYGGVPYISKCLNAGIFLTTLSEGVFYRIFKDVYNLSRRFYVTDTLALQTHWRYRHTGVTDTLAMYEKGTPIVFI